MYIAYIYIYIAYVCIERGTNAQREECGLAG